VTLCQPITEAGRREKSDHPSLRKMEWDPCCLGVSVNPGDALSSEKSIEIRKPCSY
jgi:hypothetical protein